MMWHQLQLAAAMAKAKRLQVASSAGSGATSASTSSAVTLPSPSISIKRPLEREDPENQWLKLSSWSAPPLPPHRDGDSAEHISARQRALQAAQDCFNTDLADSTVQTYDGILLREVGQAQTLLNMDFLPMTSESQFTALFGHLKAHHGEELHWSRVRTLKAAILQWHKRRHTVCIMSSWTPSMASFWNGLSKACIHTANGKEPIPIEAVCDYLEMHANTDNLVTLRNAAMVAVAFFGMRRAAEVIQFQLRDVLQEDKHGRRLRVRCQKNDQQGLGQVCLVPCIASMGFCSPHAVLNKWLEARQAAEVTSSDSPLFTTLSGSNKGAAVSYDSMRKHVVQSFGVATSTHSLRKGGAVYYSRAGASEDATRQQGGWRTSEVMKAVYTTLSAQEVEQQLHQVANSSSLAWTLRIRFKKLGKSSEEVAKQAPAVVQPYLAFVAGNFHSIDKHIIVEAKLAACLKVLTTHSDEAVRNHAIKLYTMTRSTWMAAQSASKQPKVA